MKMKHFTKKVFASVLAAGMLLSSVNMPVMAAGTARAAGFSPDRIFIVSDANPSGTELAEKVSLVSTEFVEKEVCSYMPLVYGSEDMALAGDILVSVDESMEKDSYKIEVLDGKAVLTAESPVSAMYGLRDILKDVMLGNTISDTEETPDVGQRIFHLDCGRKYFSKEWMIALVKELSWLSMNQLEVDFSNGTGFRLELDDMDLDIDGDGAADEDLSVLPGGNYEPDSWLTQSDMDEIIEVADTYGVEIVPCLDTPGHTGWIVGKESLSKYASDGELNVTDADARAFATALVKKYAEYFVSKGCTTFHIGGDEYLHAYYNWGTPKPSTEGQYGTVADYLDNLAAELKGVGVTKVRSFNDPLYYNEDTTTHIYQNIDEATYWCRWMSGFNYASPSTLASQGLGMINGHGDFYDILTGGDPNWKATEGDANTKKTPAGIYAQFDNNTFAGSVEVDDQYIVGSTYFLWCDDPTVGTQQEVAVSLYTRLRAVSAKMQDEEAGGTYAEFTKTFTESAGGFTSTGTLQEESDVQAAVIGTAAEANAAKTVIDKILAIDEITADADLQAKTAETAAARKAYEALTAEQKALVGAEVLKTLEEAEAEIEKLGYSAVDFAAAKAVEEKISLIAAQITDVSKDKPAIVAARSAYDSLSDSQKALVDADLLAKLEAAEKRLAVLEDIEKELEEMRLNACDLSRAVISPISEQSYTGKAVTPAFTVILKNKVLTAGTDYTISWANNVNAGTATAIFIGKGIYTGSNSVSFTISMKQGATVEVDGLYYQITDLAKGTAAVTGMTGSASSVKIKATVVLGGKTFRVTEIAAKAFQNNTSLKKVTIGKNVEKIGKQAFSGCKKLKTIKIQTKKLNAKKVGAKAFAKTAAKASVKVPKSQKAAYRKFLYKKGLAKSAKIK